MIGTAIPRRAVLATIVGAVGIGLVGCKQGTEGPAREDVEAEGAATQQQAVIEDVDRTLRTLQSKGPIGWSWHEAIERHEHGGILALLDRARRPGRLQAMAGVALSSLHSHEPEIVEFVERTIPDCNVDNTTRGIAMALLVSKRHEALWRRMYPILDQMTRDAGDPIHNDAVSEWSLYRTIAAMEAAYPSLRESIPPANREKPQYLRYPFKQQGGTRKNSGPATCA